MSDPETSLNDAPASLAASAAQVIARNSLLAAVDTIAGLLSTLIGSVAVARLLGPVKLGYYNYVIFLCSITNHVASFGVPLAARKYLAEHLGRGEYMMVRAIWRLTFRFQSLMAVLVVAAGLTLIAWKVPPEHRLYASLAVASLLPAMLMAMYSAANTAMEDFASNVKSSLISSAIGLAGLLLALAMRWDLPGLAAALLAERTADLLVRRSYGLRHMRRWPAPSLNHASAQQVARLADFKRSLRRFCAQAGLLQALNIIVWDRSEMLFLKHFSDIRQVAFYSLAFNITQRLLLLPRSFVSAVGASVMVRIGRDAESAAGLTLGALRLMAVLALPVSFGAAAVSDPVVRVLYGQRFLAAVPVLGILACFAAAKALMLPAQNLLVASDRQGALLKVMFATAALNLLLDYALIPSHGAIGAAVANSAAQTTAAVLAWLAALRGFRSRFPGAAFRRLLAAALSTGIVALALVRSLPTVPGLFAAVAAGVLTYALALRLLQPLPSADRDRLLQLDRQLPVALRPSWRLLLSWLFPPERPRLQSDLSRTVK